MIEKLITIIIAFAATNPRHPLYQNESGAKQIAIEITEAADRFEQDPFEILSWGIHESALRPSSVGELGEVGYMQAHGVAAAQCTAAGFVPGSFLCGAYLFERGDIQCGNHLGSLYLYASGRCEGTPRAKRMVRYRLRKAEKWKR